MPEGFLALEQNELQNIDGGDLLLGAIIVLGAIDIVLAGFDMGYILATQCG